METNPPVAVIDVGSNSIKLLVAKRNNESDGIETLFLETIETRISEGISRERPILNETALQMGLKTILRLSEIAYQYNPSQIKVVATSAVRDASNGQIFKDLVFNETGLEIQILSGPEEASLVGAGISCDKELKGISDFLQVDIGGGSLELIHFEGHRLIAAHSFQLGAVRLTERFHADKENPLSSITTERIYNHVTENLKSAKLKSTATSALPMVATGGAFSVIRAILANRMGISIENSNPSISADSILGLSRELSALPLKERMNVPHLPAARADILPSALVTIEALLNYTKHQSVTHSYYNLKYGIAQKLLQKEKI